MKHSIIFIFFIYSFLDLHGQLHISLDTIRLSEMESENVLIMGSKEKLIKLCGKPLSIQENKQFSYYKRFLSSKEKDTVFYLNILEYPENKMSYVEKDGKIRLKYLDFKKNPKAVINTPKVHLSRKLKLDELKQAYHYTEEDVGEAQLGILSPWYPNKENDCFYRIDFSTGELENIHLELYFDCKKKLRFMFIGAYDF